MAKFIKKLCGIIFASMFVFFAFNIQINTISSLPDEFKLSLYDVENLNKNKSFGSIVSADLVDEIKVGQDNVKTTKMIIKLFGFIPIKEVSVNIVEGQSVYLGGIPIGFAINTQGVIVVGNNSILSPQGNVETEKSMQLLNGDILTSLNKVKVENVDEIKDILDDNKGELVELEIIRNNEKKNVYIKPVLDSESNAYKLGLWVRNEATGIGTLTFVNMSNMKYGALGHPITDFETGIEIPVENGKIYNCNMLGIKKSKTGEPGELRCLFLQGKNEKGTVEKNTKYGVFGQITSEQGIVDINQISTVASRVSIKPGKATIVSSVSGIREEYEIEIIKTNFQPKSSDKSLVFRVKDNRLLNLTGGIVQGMSGSPILQEGKLVGAVTHVFLSDPTKGYGVYADWMIQE